MTKKKKVEAPIVRPTPPRWPTLAQYMDGVGPFRLRPMFWTYHTTLAFSPYTMGCFAWYCAEVSNVSQFMVGGPPDLGSKFAPPEKLADLFRDAYKLIKSRGKWLYWGVNPKDKNKKDWIEYNHGLPKLVFYDTELDGWEKWFSDHLYDFNRIHEELTKCGVADVELVTVTFDEFSVMSNEEATKVVDAVVEKNRIGIP